ncbi:MAG: hypothetical protein WA982_10910 [Rubrobacteraceae bacterium]
METFVAWAQVIAAVGTLGLATLTFFYVLSTREMARSNQRMVEEMQETREAQERPHIIVDADYTHSPAIDIVVRNIGNGAAEKITFDFSAALEAGRGQRNLSELPYFKNGMDFLAPGGEIRAFWDMGFSLIPALESKGLNEGIEITSTYESANGKPYKTVWTVNPVQFKDRPQIRRYGIHDMAKAITKTAESFNKAMRFGELRVSTKEERRLAQERMLAEEERMMSEDEEQDSSDSRQDG